MSRQRPASILIIIVLQVLDGLWGLGSACALLVVGGALATVFTSLEEVPDWVAALTGGLPAAIGLVLLLLALLEFVLAWGIWQLHTWAWWVTMIKAVLSILLPLLTLLSGNLSSLPTLLFNGIIIGLLLTLEVRQALGITV